jgi:dynein heavy chain, axonemal
MYNNILKTLIPVEKPLLVKKITQINAEIEPCISELKWNKDRK